MALWKQCPWTRAHFAIKLVCFFLIHWQATNILLYLVAFQIYHHMVQGSDYIFSCGPCFHHSNVQINTFFVLLALVISFFGLVYFLFQTFICPFTIAISLFFQHQSVYLQYLSSWFSLAGACFQKELLSILRSRPWFQNSWQLVGSWPASSAEPELKITDGL